MPNVKSILRDRSHAVARFTKKPWLADAELCRIFLKFIRGRESITALIKNSPDNRRIFQKRVREIYRCPLKSRRIHDLQSAKHRHASLQKPLSRFCLLLDGILSTAQEVAEVRSDHVMRTRCYRFLTDLTEGDCMKLAMMADAGCESSMLLRLVDKQFVNLTTLPLEIETFLRRIHMLFVNKKVLRQTVPLA